MCDYINDSQSPFVLGFTHFAPSNERSAPLICTIFSPKEDSKVFVESGSLSVHMKKVGSAEKTDLIRVSLPSYEIIVVQPESLQAILCI